MWPTQKDDAICMQRRVSQQKPLSSESTRLFVLLLWFSSLLIVYFFSSPLLLYNKDHIGVTKHTTMSTTNSHISMMMPQQDDEATCPDQHVCRNGAMCVVDPEKEGRYMCDCDASTDPNSVYAGLSCEHVATVYCNFENRLSETSFCTNGGTCVENIDITDSKHLGCICTDSYTGDYCEFVKIQGSSSGSSSSSSSNKSASDGPSDAVKISLSVFGVIVLITVFLGLFFVHRARYAQRLSSAGNVKKNPRKASDTDLQLEADGETMRDVKAVLHGGGETEGAKSPTSPAATADTAFSQDDAKSVQADVI